MLCAVPDWANVDNSDFPISTLVITARFAEGLSHRDYLGSLMALGITRDSIGDIVTDGEVGYVFVRSDLAEYIRLNLKRVGRYGVDVNIKDAARIILPEKKVRIINIPVISMRLDAVLAGALKLSRSGAAELIRSGRVKVNYVLCCDLSYVLRFGDLISVRGFGKLQIGETGGTSRKGKTYIQVIKYL